MRKGFPEKINSFHKFPPPPQIINGRPLRDTFEGLNGVSTHVGRQRKGSIALKVGLLPASFALA